MKVLNRVFMSNGNPLTDPDPAMSPAQVKDFWATVHPELLNAEVQGPTTTDTELVYTFHRTTGTKGRSPKVAEKSTSGEIRSFQQRLEIAAGEAPKSKSKSLPVSELTTLNQLLTPSRHYAALQLPTPSCPLLI